MMLTVLGLTQLRGYCVQRAQATEVREVRSVLTHHEASKMSQVCNKPGSHSHARKTI